MAVAPRGHTGDQTGHPVAPSLVSANDFPQVPAILCWSPQAGESRSRRRTAFCSAFIEPAASLEEAVA